MVETVSIPVNGIKLECQIIQQTGLSTRPVGLIFHPWAWLGGCMYDYTVGALTRACVESGLFSTVVRYNMRGTGGSSGFKAWSAKQDGEDAAALISALASGTGGISVDISTAGVALIAYSYGSCVAAEVMETDIKRMIVGYVSVGFPLGILSKWFLRSHSSWGILMRSRADSDIHSQGVGGETSLPTNNSRTTGSGIPIFLLMGTSDQFTSLSTLEELVQVANSSVPPQSDCIASCDGESSANMSHPGPLAPLQLHVVHGADHFDWGPELGNIVSGWLSQNMRVIE